MKYNENQIRAVSQNLKEKLLKQELESRNLIVALISMQQVGRINEEDIKTILETVYSGDKIRIVKVLTDASQTIDSELIKEIISDVETSEK